MYSNTRQDQQTEQEITHTSVFNNRSAPNILRPKHLGLHVGSGCSM